VSASAMTAGGPPFAMRLGWGTGKRSGEHAARPAAAVPAPAWTPPTWEEVVRDHSDRVFRLAYRLTGNRHDAEDLTQDVFVRVFRSLDSFTPGTFEGWLHRITVNLFLDRARRAARIRFEALPDDAERVVGRERSPEAFVTDGLLDPDIEAALAALPPDFRAAVVLCDIEQMTYDEVAAALGVKLGTVRSRISRGRAQLRAALANRAPAGAPVRAPVKGPSRAPARMAPGGGTAFGAAAP